MSLLNPPSLKNSAYVTVKSLSKIYKFDRISGRMFVPFFVALQFAIHQAANTVRILALMQGSEEKE